MRCPLSLIAALCLLLLTPCARAQDAAPSAPTLAQALAQAEAPHDTVYLAVGAEKVTLPKDSAPLPPGNTVSQVADAYGRIIQQWETVTAVAPPTMTLLNTEPGTPNPYDGMPAADALKLLLGSLDDGQWQALTGGQGLGYNALTTEAQQQLFMALFPGDTLNVQIGDDVDPEQGIKLTADDLRQARLRLSQKVTILLPNAGHPGSYSGGGNGQEDGKTHYTVSSAHFPLTDDTLYGIQVRATVPNALKPSDLNAADLTVPVSLAGVKTVGDLIGRIGAATKIELYADRRYEARTVTFVGPASARAGDLLRALALCVCGAYRKVGPAYVLTDDVMGLGKRQMILSRFAQEADIARAAALADAGDKLVARGGVFSLPPTEPGLGVTDAQRAAQQDNPAFEPFGAFPDARVPISQLTPQQQRLAGLEFQEKQQAAAAGSRSSPVTLAGTVLLKPEPVLQLFSAAVPGPVTLSNSINIGLLFQPSAALQQQLDEQRQKRMAATGGAQQAALPSSPSPATLLDAFPRRAVAAQPRTAQDVDALIKFMRRIGLNELWLDVFSQGKSRLDGEGTTDILTEALAKTKGTGIAVIPTLDLLSWGADAPKDAQDRDISGESATRTFDGRPSPETASVCPAAPTVTQALTAVVERLAATPGITALALRDTIAPGYEHVSDNDYSSGDLGYTLPLRLACLRRTHVDPVDLSVPASEEVTERTSLPDFGGARDDWPGGQATRKQWNDVRAEADFKLMCTLLAAAQASAGRPVPFLVKQRGMAQRSDWWGLWNDPRAPLPSLTMGETFTIGLRSYAPFAHTQCRVDLYALPPTALQSADFFAAALQRAKSGWDGIVIDTDTPDGSARLADLAQSLLPQANQSVTR